jgi:hypothetical protein
MKFAQFSSDSSGFNSFQVELAALMDFAFCVRAEFSGRFHKSRRGCRRIPAG